MARVDKHLAARKLTLARTLIRVVFLALLVGLPSYYLLDGPLILPISLSPQLGQNFAVPAVDLTETMLASASLPAIPLAAIVFLPLLFGRALCSWVCPIGLLHEVASTSKREGKITVYRKAKYIFLAVALLIGSIIAVQKVLNLSDTSQLENALWPFSPSPTTLFDPSSIIFDFLPRMIQGILAKLGEQPLPADILSALTQVSTIVWLRLGTLFSIIVGASRIPWFWCKYVCPSGAAQAFASRFSFLHLRRELHRCVNCRRCQRACPMDIAILKEDWKNISNAECTLCMRCVEECENRALRVSLL